MRYSCSQGSGLEYLVDNSYSGIHSNINYFSNNTVDNYSFGGNSMAFNLNPEYERIAVNMEYSEQKYSAHYAEEHSFSPQIFLSSSRPKVAFIDDENQIRKFIEEAFELMMKEKLPENISINILPFDEFKLVHSGFGMWSNGILGFSINGNEKKVFVRENHLDSLMLVIGHEIGHVLSETLPNKHDEEAKAFAFSIEWAKIIRKHNIANIGMSIRDEPDFNPTRNGLHDVAFSFVDFMVKKGRKAIELHDDLARKYTSIFNRLY